MCGPQFRLEAELESATKKAFRELSQLKNSEPGTASLGSLQKFGALVGRPYKRKPNIL